MVVDPASLAARVIEMLHAPVGQGRLERRDGRRAKRDLAVEPAGAQHDAIALVLAAQPLAECLQRGFAGIVARRFGQKPLAVVQVVAQRRAALVFLLHQFHQRDELLFGELPPAVSAHRRTADRPVGESDDRFGVLGLPFADGREGDAPQEVRVGVGLTPQRRPVADLVERLDRARLAHGQGDQQRVEMHARLAGELHLLVDAHARLGGVRVAEKQRRRERSLAKQDAGDAVLELHAHEWVSDRWQRFRFWLSDRGGCFGRSDFRFGGGGLSASARASAFGGRGFGFSGGCFGGICRLFGNGDRFGRRRGLGFGRRLGGLASARASAFGGRGFGFGCGRFGGRRFCTFSCFGRRRGLGFRAQARRFCVGACAWRAALPLRGTLSAATVSGSLGCATGSAASACLASARAFGRACSRRRWLARCARLRRYDGFGRRLGGFASARARGGRWLGFSRRRLLCQRRLGRRALRRFGNRLFSPWHGSL
jgi:hypothetical protein